MFSAKHRSRIRRIIPFGIIWWLSGVIYCLLEKAILKDSLTYPGSTIPYDFWRSLVTVGPFTLIEGLVLGTFEVYVLHRLFAKRAFWQQMVAKSSIYIGALVLSIVAVMTIANSTLLQLPLSDPEVLRAALRYFTDPSFWGFVAYNASVVVISLLFSEVTQHIGLGVLRNFFMGKYHTPKEEERIFLFLDMKSSTTLAEQMGHAKYFGLLGRYYADMTEAIIASSGEIYQYAGDEIVITWTMTDGVRDNNWLECFFRIKERLEDQAPAYLKSFGHAPAFKAGAHCGHVTTGEIGSVRKDIIFTGDVMNTTARVQSLCNENGVDLLVSEALMARMVPAAAYRERELGLYTLKGKDEGVRLYTVVKA